MLGLSANAWSFIGVIVAIVFGFAALGLTYYIYHRQREVRELAYAIVSDTEPFSIDSAVRGHIEVRFDGHLMDDLRIVTIAIENTGNRPIQREEFDRPIGFDFGEPSDILSAEVSSSRPNNLQPEIVLIGHAVEVRPLLLNAGDALAITVAVSGHGNRLITANGRIVGGEIRHGGSPRGGGGQQDEALAGQRDAIRGAAFLGLLVSLGVFIFEAFGAISDFSTPLVVVSGVYGFLSILVMVFASSSYREGK